MSTDVALYFAIQVLANYAVYRLIRAAKISGPFQIGLATFVVGLTAATMSVGLFGLIFGLPSILVTSVSMGAILHQKERSCDSDFISRAISKVSTWTSKTPKPKLDGTTSNSEVVPGMDFRCLRDS